MTRVLALDLSLRATGVANEYGTRVIKGPRPEQFRANRLNFIHDELLNNFARPVGHNEEFVYPDVCLIESAGYFKGDAQYVLELHGVVKLALHRLGIPFVLVAPALVKKFATGAGNSDKDHVLAAAIRKFEFQGVTNDEADAWIMWFMGKAHYEGLPAIATDYQRQALAKIEWPEIASLYPTEIGG